jgi:hypothetical protein
MIPKRVWFLTRTLVILVLLLSGVPGSLYPARPAAAPVASGDAPGTARLTAEQAIAVAVNGLEATADGFRLRHPRHVATFTRDGVQFTPRGGGPEWAWRLTRVMASEMPLAGVEVGPVQPARESSLTVAYRRGGVVEQYAAREATLEQQFTIPRPLPLRGADLVIAGEVRSAGTLEARAEGWCWRTAEGAVCLGPVRAYDAGGRDLPARMEVSAATTRIVVDGKALAQAAYPVTVDPEIGTNDFRLSDMGGDTLFDAFTPAVAYNSTDDEYLVVWWGDDNTAPLVDNEAEIFGQRVDAATGAEIGSDFRLSDMGTDGNVNYGAATPAVAYNSTDNEYLVVWAGDDDTFPLANEEFEIYGQRVQAATGAEIGSDLRLSDMNFDGNPNFDALFPAVAYDSTNNQYLVVWQGDDGSFPLVDEEFEIYGQRVQADGTEVGANDFRLSDMGPDGDANFDALSPKVAYNSTNDECLVVWWGDDNSGGLLNDEAEIFGQRVQAGTGAEIGSDFRLSDMGTNGLTAYGAASPAVAYNSTNNEYLVVWWGDDVVDNEFEIFGQRLDGVSGTEVGTNDFRLSDMGPDGDTNYGATLPAVAYDRTNNEYLVVWLGDDDSAPPLNSELEIFGQRVQADGTEVGTNDFRLSDMGPDGNVNYGTGLPAVAYDRADNQYLVVWAGDDDTAPLVDEEKEIFGQRVNGGSGAEVGSDFRLSDMGGDVLFGAGSPAVAYNSTDNEYLVVWSGDDNTLPLVDNEVEIFGQRVDGATGAEIGTDFRLSDMGTDGNVLFGAFAPAVAYNSTDNEYLVVWQGDDNSGALVDNEFEIYGQRVQAATGAEIGSDFRLSDMGLLDGNTNYTAQAPAVAYDRTDNQYLVVWNGDDNTPPLVDNEYEIFGQRVQADGTEILPNDFRLSNMGPDGSVSYEARDPAIAYNGTDNEYLVVWQGEDDTWPLVMNEFEIFGQRVQADTGSLVGTDIRLSDMGTDGLTAYGASNSAVAYNGADNEYLVVWVGDDMVDNEREVFGQRVNADGTEIGTNDFRLSDMGPDGDIFHSAFNPAVAYNSTNSEYLVVWWGDDDTGGLVNNEYEIFGQRLNADGTEVDTNDFRLSDMGPDGDTAYAARNPAAAYNSTNSEYLVVWQGDDNTPPLVDNEVEIFGQRFSALFRIYLPLVLRNSP